MLKKLLLTSLLTLITLQAAYAADLKIAVIDLRKIVHQSSQAVAINKKLEKEFKARQQKIIADQKALEKDVNNLNKNKSVMKESELSALQDNVLRQRRDLQRMTQDYQQDLTVARNRAMQEYLASYLPKVKKAIDQIAKKGRYDLVVQKEVVPYSSSQLEITTQVEKAIR